MIKYMLFFNSFKYIIKLKIYIFGRNHYKSIKKRDSKSAHLILNTTHRLLLEESNDDTEILVAKYRGACLLL